MRNVVDLGKLGAEHIDVSAPAPSESVAGMVRLTPIIDRMSTSTIETEVEDGAKRSVEAHTLLLSNPDIFGLVRELSRFSLMVYARKGQRTVMGILSPNYDEHGESRLPTIKVLPLRTPYPLVAKSKNDVIPNAEMAVMLSGSAHAEGAGAGSHDKPAAEDYEHKLTILGAVSLGRTTIMENGAHVQHDVRKKNSSVAAGMTGGKLGNLYVPDGENTGGFTGYDLPMIFTPGAVQPTDAIFIPRSFLHNEAAYGVHYTDASRISYGVSMQVLHERHGQVATSNMIKQVKSTA